MPQRSTADERSFGWWGEIVVMSHLRFAAGVCVLAAGLLMGGAGGAVAVADPGSSGSAAHGDDGTNASGQQSSTDAKKPKKTEPGGKDTKDGTHDAGGQSGQQPFHRHEKPKDEPGGTDTKDEKKDAGLVAAVPITSRRFPMRRRRPPMRSRRPPMRRRRLPIWSGRFLTLSRRFRTCSPRLPVRSSRSRNCSPTFTPSCWASPGWRRFQSGRAGF